MRYERAIGRSFRGWRAATRLWRAPEDGSQSACGGGSVERGTRRGGTQNWHCQPAHRMGRTGSAICDGIVRAWIRAEEVREARTACAHRWGIEYRIEPDHLSRSDGKFITTSALAPRRQPPSTPISRRRKPVPCPPSDARKSGHARSAGTRWEHTNHSGACWCMLGLRQGTGQAKGSSNEGAWRTRSGG